MEWNYYCKKKTEEVKKLSGDKNTIEKQSKKKEKDDKKEKDNLKEDVRIFKEKVEEMEGISSQNSKTIINLNQYLEDLREVNKKLVVNGRGNEKYSDSQRISIDDKIPIIVHKNNYEYNYEYNNQNEGHYEEMKEMEIRIYVGNIDESATEEEIKRILELNRNDKVEIKVKRRKQTKQVCREEGNCRYKHFCKYVHLDELYETMKYAVIEVGVSKKNEVLSKDGYRINEKEIIVEEYPRIGDKKITNTKVCTFFLQKKCNKGNQCTYRHPKECTFYKETGNCRYANNCRFAHMKKQNGEQVEGTMLKNQNLEQMEGMMRYMAQFLPRTPMFVPQNLTQPISRY